MMDVLLSSIACAARPGICRLAISTRLLLCKTSNESMTLISGDFERTCTSGSKKSMEHTCWFVLCFVCGMITRVRVLRHFVLVVDPFPTNSLVFSSPTVFERGDRPMELTWGYFRPSGPVYQCISSLDLYGLAPLMACAL